MAYAQVSTRAALVDENGNARSADPPLPATGTPPAQLSPAILSGWHSRVRVMRIAGPAPAARVTQLAAGLPGLGRDDEALPRPPHAEANHTPPAYGQQPGHGQPGIYRPQLGPTPLDPLLPLEYSPRNMPKVDDSDDLRTSGPGPFLAIYLCKGPDEEPYEGEEPLIQYVRPPTFGTR